MARDASCAERSSPKEPLSSCANSRALPNDRSPRVERQGQFTPQRSLCFLRRHAQRVYDRRGQSEQKSRFSHLDSESVVALRHASARGSVPRDPPRCHSLTPAPVALLRVSAVMLPLASYSGPRDPSSRSAYTRPLWSKPSGSQPRSGVRPRRTRTPGRRG